MVMQLLWFLPLLAAAHPESGVEIDPPGGEEASPLEVVIDGVPSNISADSLHTCALTVSGRALCWGAGRHGRLGTGDTETRNRPAAVASEESFVSIGTGLDFTCALTAGGDAWCWGRGGNGRLGNGETRNETTPVRVSGDLEFKTIDVGRHHTCGLTSDGTAYCWGYGGDGKLGNGSTESSTRPNPVDTSLRFSSISAGSYLTCGVTTDGEAWCWGSGSNGKRGDGEASGIAYDPRRVLGGHRFASIYAGHQHVCALTQDGKAWCWGANGSRQLGDGSNTRSAEPVEVGGGIEFTSLSLGKFHTCGTTASGKAWCWGSNGRGKAGVDRPRGGYLGTPEEVVGIENFVAIAAGHDHTCGTTSDNKVYCWGNAGSGRLGTGDETNRASPEFIIDLSEPVALH